MRPRKKNRHLPPKVHPKHGAFYYVHAGKWTRIGTTIQEVYDYCKRLTLGYENSIPELLDEVVADAEQRNAKPNTLRGYRLFSNKLKTIFAEFTPADVKPRHVDELMRAWQHKPNSANNMRLLLKLAFDKAVLRELCPTNPVESIHRIAPPKRDRYMTDGEYMALWNAASPALRVIMDIAYLTGQRISDVLAIRLSDISDEGIFFKQGKTGKRLLVKMSPQLRDAINRAKALHGNMTPIYLLGNRRGQKRSYEGVWKLFSMARAMAGVKDVTIHDIRAKAITDAKKQNKNPKALGGHSTEAMTNRYIRSRDTEVADGPEFLGVLDKSKITGG